MKIVLISEDYLPNTGGIAYHVDYLARGLHKSGHEVHIINSSRHPSLEENDKEIHIHRSAPDKLIKSPLSLFIFMLQRVEFIRQILEKEIPKIVHIHTLIDLFSIQFIKPNINSTWIFTNHSSTFLRLYNNFFWRIILKMLMKKVSLVICVSSEILKKTLKLHPNSIFISNGVDLKKFKPLSSNDRKTERRKFIKKFDITNDPKLIFIVPRRLDMKNGVIYAVKAANKLKLEGLSFLMILMGGGSAAKEVYDEIEYLHAAEYIRHIGTVSNQYMPILNNIADLIIIPSLVEAVSLAALEAIACGKKIVSSDADGLVQIYRDIPYGAIALKTNPDDLAEKIKSILKGKPKVKTDLNRKIVEKFYSWEKVVEKTIEAYQK